MYNSRRPTPMLRRTTAIMLLPLLVLTAACSSPVTAGEPTAAPRVTEVPNVGAPSGSTNPNEVAASPSDDQPHVGISTKTIDGHIWAEPIISGETIGILRSVASMEDHVHFEVPGENAPLAFVGYFVGPAFLAKPCICPSCGDEGVDWSAGALSCQSCPAVYDAVSGSAKEGGICYPAGLIPNRILGDTIVMTLNDLVTAYERVVAGEGALAPDGGDGQVPSCCPNH
jgi:hypothetical protein